MLRTCVYDLIWRVFPDDQGKMKALGWALIQCLCPSQKGKFEHKDRYTEKMSCGNCKHAATSQGTPKIASKTETMRRACGRKYL